jgi:hypothetical protein
LFTPKRIYQTDWKVVEKWSTSITLPEIDRQIDAILARCLRSAGYVVEHVAKTKDTDRSYWKEAHVSSLFNVAIVIALLMRIRRLLAAPNVPRNLPFCTDVPLIICAVARLRIKSFTPRRKLC